MDGADGVLRDVDAADPRALAHLSRASSKVPGSSRVQDGGAAAEVVAALVPEAASSLTKGRR